MPEWRPTNLLKRIETLFDNFQHLAKNPVLLFTANRYVAYALTFIKGVLIARFLGPNFFGIWGFLMLVNQYLSYTSLGIQYAINVDLATESAEQNKDEKIAVAFTLTTLIMVLLSLLGLGIWGSNFPVFSKYSFNQYAMVLSLVAGLNHFLQLFANIYRVYGHLLRIAIGEFISALLPLLSVLVFRGDALIFALLWAMIISRIISCIIFLVKPPFRLLLSLDFQNIRHLLSLGIPLLFYNISFYLIMISGRTIVSTFYSVEIMGYYSLANSITTASMLGLKAIAWVVFPDVLSRVHSDVPNKRVASTVRRVNDLYGTAVFLCVVILALFLPLLFLFLPEYKPVEKTLKLLLLSQTMLSASFGYNCLAIAREKQIKVAGISLIAVAVVTCSGILGAYLGFDFVWIAICMFLGTFVFALLQIRLGIAMLKQESATGIVEAIGLGKIVASILFLVGTFLGYPILSVVVALGSFVLLDRKKLRLLLKFLLGKVDVKEKQTEQFGHN